MKIQIYKQFNVPQAHSIGILIHKYPPNTPYTDVYPYTTILNIRIGLWFTTFNISFETLYKQI
jgi:hypothetical protein